MPVNRLKLFAFGVGAGIAGFTGCMFATLLTGRPPGNFDVPMLITIYAVVILGGVRQSDRRGPGGARDRRFVPVPRLENPQNNARVLFYTASSLTIYSHVRSWSRHSPAFGGTSGFGVLVHAIVGPSGPTDGR